jgi:hypothetical protein
VSRILLVLGLVGAIGCAKGQPPGADIDGGAGDDGDARPGAIDAMLPPPDANNCATQPCDILTECGCTVTQSCDIDVSDLMGTACRQVNTAGTETSACNSLDDCDHGYVCLGPAGESACRKYCDSNADCGQPRGQCVIDLTNGGNPIPGVPSVCSSNCDPMNVAAGGCPTGFKCGLFTQQHQSMTYPIADCSIASATGGQGTNCKVGSQGDDSLCPINHLCTTTNAGVMFVCRRVCNLSAGGTPCAATCLPFNPAFVLAGVQYGVCQ